MRSARETLEEQQIAVYFTAVAAGALVALTLPGVFALEAVINPALAVMLFAASKPPQQPQDSPVNIHRNLCGS